MVRAWAWRISAVAAMLLDAGTVAIYLAVIDAQGDESVTDPAIVGWALAMALPGLLSALAAVTASRTAPFLLVPAALVAGGIGVLAIFSVGLLLLGVAAISFAAALISLSARHPQELRPAPR